jgi:hypothetical protein
MKSIFGGLLEFSDDEKLQEFAEKLDMKTSVKILENSIEYGLKNGLYSLEEAYCLYMCIHKLKAIEKIV